MVADSSQSPFTETVGQARHAAYADLVAAGPVQRIVLFTGVPVWLVTGYAEIRELLTCPEIVKGGTAGMPHREFVPGDIAAAMDQHVLSADPPNHGRLRQLVSAAFTRRRVVALEPRVRQITEELLHNVGLAGVGGTPVDLVKSFGYPLPLAVICDLLGVPQERRADFQDWSNITINGAVYPAETFAGAATALVSYVRELIAEKRATPADDLLSALVAVRAESDRLSENELTSLAFLLLIAGHETTVHLICGGIHALLTNPDQLDLLRAEPDRLPAAVEEFLRFDGPAQVTTPYVTSAPVRIGDVTIPSGEVVLAALLAANRDPKQFPNPARLDITRTPAQHLAFGHGIHHCLGAPLARLEGRIAIGMLVDRYPDLRLAVPADELSWHRGLLINGLTALPVTLQ